MWIVQWLVDRFDDVKMVFEDKVKLIRKYLLDLYVYLYALAIVLYNRIVYLASTIYDKLSRLAVDLYSRLAYLAATLYAAIKKLAEDWYDRIRDFIQDWFARAKKLAVDYFDWIAALAVTWRTRLVKLARDWWDLIDWFVNVAFTALKDFKDHWLAGAKIIATAWRAVLDWYTNTVFPKFKNFADTWYDGAKILATTWFDGLKILVTTWFSGIRMLVTTLFDAVHWLTTTAFPYLLDLINNLYTTLSTLARSYSSGIVSFFDAPADWLLGILETVAWRWVEWFGSTLLGGVVFVPPPRPNFGGGAPGTGEPPPGPGPGGQGLIWPSSSHTISGYHFTPPTHNGIDIGAGDGNPIWAIRGGTVTNAGWSTSGYGYYVDIQHDQGWWSRYGHAKQLYVHQNQHVEQGQTIMLCDSTGNSTGPHLHLEIKHNGAYVDPLQVLG